MHTFPTHDEQDLPVQMTRGQAQGNGFLLPRNGPRSARTPRIFGLVGNDVVVTDARPKHVTTTRSASLGRGHEQLQTARPARKQATLDFSKINSDVYTDFPKKPAGRASQKQQKKWKRAALAWMRALSDNEFWSIYDAQRDQGRAQQRVLPTTQREMQLEKMQRLYTTLSDRLASLRDVRRRNERAMCKLSNVTEEEWKMFRMQETKVDSEEFCDMFERAVLSPEYENRFHMYIARLRMTKAKLKQHGYTIHSAIREAQGTKTFSRLDQKNIVDVVTSPQWLAFELVLVAAKEGRNRMRNIALGFRNNKTKNPRNVDVTIDTLEAFILHEADDHDRQRELREMFYTGRLTGRVVNALWAYINTL